MIGIGRTVWLKPYGLIDYHGKSVSKPIPGKVVYINDQHKYFTVEFNFPGGGKYRESFKFDEIEDK